MYKTTVHCLNDEYFLETEEEVNVYCHEGIVYLQNKQSKDIFAINKDRLEAIDLNTYEEIEEEEELVVNYVDGEKVTINNTYDME